MTLLSIADMVQGHYRSCLLQKWSTSGLGMDATSEARKH